MDTVAAVAGTNTDSASTTAVAIEQRLRERPRDKEDRYGDRLFGGLVEARSKIDRLRIETQAALKPLWQILQLEELMAAVAEQRVGVSKYPSSEELGITLHTAVCCSDELSKKIGPACKENEEKKGHIELLLKTIRKTPDETLATRVEAKKLLDTLVLCYLKIDQYDTLLNAILNASVSMSNKELAKHFCEFVDPNAVPSPGREATAG